MMGRDWKLSWSFRKREGGRGRERDTEREKESERETDGRQGGGRWRIRERPVD